MKKTSLYFLILILLVSNILSAQQPQLVLPLPGDVAQSAATQDSFTTMPSSQFDLIDLTGDSLVLGYLPLKEGGNDRQAVVTPISKSDWLRELLHQSMQVARLQGGQILYYMC